MLRYTCDICSNDWSDTEPLRSLSCGHTFCHPCIQRHLEHDSPRAFCPTCRAGPILQYHLRPVFVTVSAIGTMDPPAIGQGSPTHQHDVAAIEAALVGIKLDNEERLADRHEATQLQLARAREEVEGLRESLMASQAEVEKYRNQWEKEMGESSWRAMKLGGELLDAHKELTRVTRELKRAREEMDTFKTKYDELSAKVKAAFQSF
ncbi:unnamed protein product [Peniophora sp. CBMAI 1063]|nr:unnamed protein product [Peniophora sp. CBMAI 1063]